MFMNRTPSYTVQNTTESDSLWWAGEEEEARSQAQWNINAESDFVVSRVPTSQTPWVVSGLQNTANYCKALRYRQDITKSDSAISRTLLESDASERNILRPPSGVFVVDFMQFHVHCTICESAVYERHCRVMDLAVCIILRLTISKV